MDASAPAVFADPAQTASLFWRYLGAVALYTGVLAVLMMAAANWLKRRPDLLQILRGGRAGALPPRETPPDRQPFAGVGAWFRPRRLPASPLPKRASAAGPEVDDAPLRLEATLALEPGRTTYLACVGAERFLLACDEHGVKLLARMATSADADASQAPDGRPASRHTFSAAGSAADVEASEAPGDAPLPVDASVLWSSPGKMTRLALYLRQRLRPASDARASVRDIPS